MLECQEKLLLSSKLGLCISKLGRLSVHFGQESCLIVRGRGRVCAAPAMATTATSAASCAGDFVEILRREGCLGGRRRA